MSDSDAESESDNAREGAGYQLDDGGLGGQDVTDYYLGDPVDAEDGLDDGDDDDNPDNEEEEDEDTFVPLNQLAAGPTPSQSIHAPRTRCDSVDVGGTCLRLKR